MLKRAITGAIYTFLLLVAIMLSPDAFGFLFLVFGLICLYEFKRLVRLSGYYVFVFFLVVWWVLFYLQDIRSTPFLMYVFLLAVLATDAILIFFLFDGKEGEQGRSFSEIEKYLLAIFYVGGGCIFIPMLYYSDVVEHLSLGEYSLWHLPSSIIPNDSQHTMIAILCIIWASDSFAYLVGRSFGKTKLFPSVSPKKTIEGFAGGFVAAVLVGLAFSFYSQKPWWAWVIVAALLVVAGTVGDLIESKFKRIAGKKDSGTILPGHGGLFDRLDSLIYCSPIAFLIFQIIYYVS